jgi:hypothetical protein
MPKRRAQFTQPECTRFLKAAKKAGVPWVAIRLGDLPLIVPLNEQNEQCVDLLRALPLLTAEQCVDLLRALPAPHNVLAGSEDIVL